MSAASGKLARVLSACTIALVLALCVNPFVVLASPLTFSMIGDLDVDGQVGILDLALLSSEYLKTSVHTEWQSEFDLNGDLIIDLYDFVVISKWMGCPGAPQQVSAQPGDRHVVVSFVPPQSDGGHTITGYTVRVYREAVLEAHLGTTEASGPVSVTGLTNGLAYSFGVIAHNSAGRSLESYTSEVTPASVPDVPTGVSASAGDAQALVTFVPPEQDGGSAILYYTVYVYQTGAHEPHVLVTASESPVLITGLTNDASYVFSVAATNAIGDSAQSALSEPVVPSRYTLIPFSGSLCYCGLPITHEGAFTHTVEFEEDGRTVSALAIFAPAQLQHLAMHRNSDAILMNDLDFSIFPLGNVEGTPMHALASAVSAGISYSGHSVANFVGGNFVPIGSSSTNSYTGTLYGNGKSISGLIIAAENAANVGLFGHVTGGVIKDAHITSGQVSAIPGTLQPIGNCVGSFVGLSKGGTLHAVSNAASVSGYFRVGGLVGENDAGTISASYNSGAVSGTRDYIGGIVGNSFNACNVIDCHNAGEVTGYERVGGIVGYLFGYDYARPALSLSSNSGRITATRNSAGGIVGQNAWGTVDNSHNSADVSARADVGGVIGSHFGVASVLSNSGCVSGYDSVGGVVGNHVKGTLANSYNTGSVTGTNYYTGGVVGWNNDDAIVDEVYNVGSVQGRYHVGGVVGWNAGGGWNTDGGVVSLSHNMGVVTGTGSVGGVVGNNSYDSSYRKGGSVSGVYNTGAVLATSISAGGIVGYNSGQVGESYNAGTVKATSYAGGVIGTNSTTGTVTDCHWLLGTNLRPGSEELGIGDGSGTTSTFADAQIGSIHVSMSDISASAGGMASGAITGIEFSAFAGASPPEFGVLQASYSGTQGEIVISVHCVPSTTLSVETSTDLPALVSTGGTEVSPEPVGDGTYSITVTSGTWVLIRALAEQPVLSRTYTIYTK